MRRSLPPGAPRSLGSLCRGGEEDGGLLVYAQRCPLSAERFDRLVFDAVLSVAARWSSLSDPRRALFEVLEEFTEEELAHGGPSAPERPPS